MRRALLLFFAFIVSLSGLAYTESVGNDYLSKLTLEGAGASFPYPIYSKWADAYNKETGMKLNYQSIGSGGGIRQIKSKTVNFGASDIPLKAEELNEAGLMQFPMVMGGVVPVFNVAGIDSGKIKISGEVLANIYLGKITKWNDAAITALNAGITLPDKPITVVHRSDGSGTTWIFTNYLSKVSAEWNANFGNNSSIAWPTGIGGKGNEGVANSVKQVDGAIGYVEYAYALQNKLTYPLLLNDAGKYVAPTGQSFQAAAANADWKGTPGFSVVLTDQPGDDSWPITGASFILVYKNNTDWKMTRAMLQFFDWAFRNGAKMADELDYVPIPLNVVNLIAAVWAKEIVADGKPVWEIAAAFEIPQNIKDIISKHTLEGAGASFPYPIYSKWGDAFNKKYGMKLNYQSIGSGGGIRQIKAKTVSFGASDAPLSVEDLDAAGMIQFPMVIGGVVLVVNLEGLAPGSIKLDPSILANIYMGKITKWNDAALASINPGVKLPDKAITVVHRSDGSGTTWIFTNYLCKISEEWKANFGNNASIAWPTGIGGKGNEGVANSVKQVDGAIGYVEYAYALQNKLSYTLIKNKAGIYVAPTNESFQAAAASADWAGTPGYNVVLTDQSGEKSWPITGASFILIHKDQPDMNNARCMLTFFNWCLRMGSDMAAELDYVPMPLEVADLIETYWRENVKSAGVPCWK